MTTFAHTTVLLNETVELTLRGVSRHPGANRYTFADCTLGGAGHSLHLLETFSTQMHQSGRTDFIFEILCCDQDPVALGVARERLSNWKMQREQTRENFELTLLPINFRELPEWLKTNRPQTRLCGLLADLGVSSPQLDEADRGFSFLREGPLDMRMNQHDGLTARDLLLNMSEKELATIFHEYGEEPRARVLAKAIVKDRQNQTLPLSNTTAFAQYAARVLGYHQSRVHPATRVFQALRIAVNEELGAIEELLQGLPEIMDEDSWAAVISFHSLEDRLVKRYFRAWESGSMNPDQKKANDKQQWLELQMGLMGNATSTKTSLGHEDPRGGTTASEEEIKSNPRSRSARLRGFHFERRQ
ncbi:MAG: 16S rRNA (cytosine(1402)-N(4))-methyltransferase RsmH [Betaproteobacteria bacterium]|nr:16S rRNA (cytosine(1402)-N(4))-methyltransferase RsmH [Betaproteobacteria bacterium]